MNPLTVAGAADWLNPLISLLVLTDITIPPRSRFGCSIIHRHAQTWAIERVRERVQRPDWADSGQIGPKEADSGQTGGSVTLVAINAPLA